MAAHWTDIDKYFRKLFKFPMQVLLVIPCVVRLWNSQYIISLFTLTAVVKFCVNNCLSYNVWWSTDLSLLDIRFLWLINVNICIRTVFFHYKPTRRSCTYIAIITTAQPVCAFALKASSFWLHTIIKLSFTCIYSGYF